MVLPNTSHLLGYTCTTPAAQGLYANDSGSGASVGEVCASVGQRLSREDVLREGPPVEHAERSAPAEKTTALVTA